MKLYSNLLALSALHSGTWATSAFFVQAPKSRAFKGRTHSFSYLEHLSGDAKPNSSALKDTSRQGDSSYAGTAPSSPGLRDPKVAPQPSASVPQSSGMAMASSGSSSAAFGAASATQPSSNMGNMKNILETVPPISVQGGSLRTWSFQTAAVKRAKVILKTEGRPLNANIDLWQGPDNTPQKMGVYIEDGSIRPFCALIETPRGHSAVAIRNTGQMEFPLFACVEADVEDSNGVGSANLAVYGKTLTESSTPEVIQGGAIKTFSFDPQVASVQVLLKTDGRPLNARIELLQGPNNNKQVVELYTENGMERPFFAVIETPGTGNVVRVCNTAPVEFPLNARVEPYMVEETSFSHVVVSDEIGQGWESKLY